MNLKRIVSTMRKYITNILLSLVILFSTGLFAGAASDKAATVVPDAIWANGLLYGTAATTNSFKNPPPHTVDIIYSFAESGLSGQRSVSEAAPGDTDYNGGRWWVHFVYFTPTGLAIHDPDGDGVVNFELTSAEQVLVHMGLGHLEVVPMEVYFSCPLRGPGEAPE